MNVIILEIQIIICIMLVLIKVDFISLSWDDSDI